VAATMTIAVEITATTALLNRFHRKCDCRENRSCSKLLQVIGLIVVPVMMSILYLNALDSTQSVGSTISAA